MKKTVLLISLLFLLVISTAVTAQTVASFDTVTIYDLQFVPPESLAVGQDDSPFLGDTVIVEGIVATGPRSLWAGARWSLILVDEKGGAWNGIQIIQHDTTKEGTNMSALKPGYRVRLTGLVEEFSYGAPPSQSQLALLTDPPVPVEPIEFGLDIPEPTLLTCADLAADDAEKYEATFIMIKNATVINDNLPGDQMLIADATGQLVVDDWGKVLHDSLDTGEYQWPPNGTNIDIKGYIRSDPNGTGFQLGPITSADITILTNPPQISDVIRNPGVPTSSDQVVVSAKIIDTNGTVDDAQLHFKVGDQAWQVGSMTTSDSIYTATIPPAADGAMVRYFIRAIDNHGDWSMVPGDTSANQFFYVIRDAGLSIKDVQWTPFQSGDSPYLGYEVTLTGVVTASPDDFLGDYVIQSSQAPWSGIWVDDAVHLPQRGDSVRVTGMVQEYYSFTRLSQVTDLDTIATGYSIEPLKITTGQATTGSAEAESYEGVLLQFDNVIVTNPFADVTANYGEFVIDDGSGGYRVDDVSATFRGNLDSTFALNDRIEKIIGVGYYSFGNYKLEPRNDNDIIGHITEVKQNQPRRPLSYELNQNYPNPFNPTTTINYTLAKNGLVELTVYNLMGQKIKTLVHEVKQAGQHVVQWDGRNNAGLRVSSGLYFYTLKTADFVKTNKMILLR